MIPAPRVLADVILDLNPRRKQIFSKTLVEPKRLGRTLPAVINGLTASQAQAQGFVGDSSDAENDSHTNSESLFIDGGSDDEQGVARSRSGSPVRNEPKKSSGPLNPRINPIAPTAIFGQPSTKGSASLPVTSEQSHTNTRSGHDSHPPGSLDHSPFAYQGASTSNPFLVPSVPSQGSASTEVPKFNFFPTAGTSKPVDSAPPHAQSTATSQASPSTSVFGRTSSPFSGTASVSKPPNTTSSALSFPWSTSPVPANSKAKSDQDGVDNGQQENHSQMSLEAPQAKAPIFSFGTSPLFESPISNEQTQAKPNAGSLQAQIGLSSVQEKTTKSLVSFDRPSMTSPSASPPAQTPTSGASALTSTINTEPLFATISPPAQSSSATLSTLFNPKSTPTQAMLKPSNPDNPSLAAPQKSELPSAATVPLGPQSSAAMPKGGAGASTMGALGSDSVSVTPSKGQSSLTATEITKSSFRSPVIDELAKIMMTEEGGLLQQFVEFTIAPIIRTSVRLFEDEKSWARASQWFQDANHARKRKLMLVREMSWIFAR